MRIRCFVPQNHLGISITIHFINPCRKILLAIYFFRLKLADKYNIKLIQHLKTYKKIV